MTQMSFIFQLEDIGIEVQTVQVIFYICKIRLNECLRQNLQIFWLSRQKKKYPSRYYSYLFKEAILWKLSIVWNVIFSNIVVYYVFFLLILALIMIFFISLYCCQLRQIFYSSTFHRLPIGLAILAFGKIK